jgi:hypothetical protein
MVIVEMGPTKSILAFRTVSSDLPYLRKVVWWYPSACDELTEVATVHTRSLVSTNNLPMVFAPPKESMVW